MSIQSGLIPCDNSYSKKFMFKSKLTPQITKLLENVVRYESRIDGIEFDHKWKRELQKKARTAESLATYRFHSSNTAELSELYIKNSGSLQDHLLFLKEMQARREMDLYFKNKITEETAIYLHRFLDNLDDDISKERGKYRKSQIIKEGEILSEYSGYMRYGFVPRIMEDFFEELHKTNLSSFLIAPLIVLNFVAISPFFRNNFLVARFLAKGYLYKQKIDQDVLLRIDDLLSSDFKATKRALLDGLSGKESVWVEYYLSCMLKAYKVLDNDIKVISGGSVYASKNEIMQLTKRQIIILDLINSNSQMSISELAKLLGITRQSVFEIVQKLYQKGLLSRVGSSTTTRYKIKK